MMCSLTAAIEQRRKVDLARPSREPQLMSQLRHRRVIDHRYHCRGNNVETTT